jgi:type I restriction enzyme M protein
MFAQKLKNIDDILHKDAGCGSELDYVEQTSWILFIKYLDDLEQDKKDIAELTGKAYKSILPAKYRWHEWAMPLKADGTLDDHKALTGDDLVDFVNDMFKDLRNFKKTATSPNTIEYKIGEIFSELNNRIRSGYNLRGVIEHVNDLRFKTSEERHEMSHLYESKINNMGNAGRNGGEYYTPRPLIKAIIDVVDPKIGDKIYDGAVGSAGFLVEAFNHLNTKDLSTEEYSFLQTKALTGKEKKALPYIIAIINMILHGIESPNIIHTNTLAEPINDLNESERFDVILANPPFGGKERAEVQQNFTHKTGETASLFLQHFMKYLKPEGKAGIVIKNTFLSNTDVASIAIRKELLEGFNLHTVLDLPGGTFTGAGVKTVVLFFEKGEATKDIWYYQLNPGRNMGKTNPLNSNDLKEFIKLQKTRADSENSWTVALKDIDQETLDLSAKNPNKKDETILRTPEQVIAEMKTLDNQSAGLLTKLEGLL